MTKASRKHGHKKSAGNYVGKFVSIEWNDGNGDWPSFVVLAEFVHPENGRYYWLEGQDTHGGRHDHVPFTANEQEIKSIREDEG